MANIAFKNNIDTQVGHLSAILVPMDRNFNKTIFKSSNARGVAWGKDGHRDV